MCCTLRACVRDLLTLFFLPSVQRFDSNLPFRAFGMILCSKAAQRMPLKGAAERARKHVREWEAAYKSKHGSTPRYEHYAALATDRTMHGMLAHRAYVEYNKLTDGALEKSLKAAAASAAGRYSSINSSKAPRAGAGWEKGGGGTSDVLKLLVPKVETRNQRPAFSSIANIAERGANPLLALADGYAKPAKPEAGKRDALLSSAVAPVSVKLSKRAASLQQLSEVAAAEALAVAARRRKRPSSQKSDAQPGSSSSSSSAAAAAEQEVLSGAPAQKAAASDSDDSDYDSSRPLPRRQPRPANSLKLGGGKRTSAAAAVSAEASAAASRLQHVPPAVRLQASAAAAAAKARSAATISSAAAAAGGVDRSDREKLLLKSVAVAPLPAAIASVPGMRILDTTSHAAARSAGTAAAAAVAAAAGAAAETRTQRHSEPPQRSATATATAAHSTDTRSEWRQRVAETLSRLQEESAEAQQQAAASAAASTAAAASAAAGSGGEDVAAAGASAVHAARVTAAASTAEPTAAVASSAEQSSSSTYLAAGATAAADVSASAGSGSRATVQHATAEAQTNSTDSRNTAGAAAKSTTAKGSSSSSDSRKRQRGAGSSAAVGQVSDNFVRMDLKRKGTCKFKKQGGALGGRFSASRSDSNSSSGSGKRGGGKWGSKWGKGDYSKHSNSSSNSEDPVTGEQHNGSAAARDKPLSSGAAKCHGGVDALDQCLDALATAAASAADSSTTAADGENEEDVLKRLAPRCPRHQRAAKLLTVRKAGGNRGRKFYGCSLPRGEGCGFFMWAEVSHTFICDQFMCIVTSYSPRPQRTLVYM
jgi:GRF zinc finger